MSGDKRRNKEEQADLLGWVLDEADTGFDVGLEALDGFPEQLLLVVIGAAEDVDGLFGSIGLWEGLAATQGAGLEKRDLRRAPQEPRSTRSRWPWR